VAITVGEGVCAVKAGSGVGPARCAGPDGLGPDAGAGIERGDDSPVEPVLSSPHQVRVGTWPLRFRALALTPAERTPEAFGCILSAPGPWRLAGDCAPPSSIDPGPVLPDGSHRSVPHPEPWPCPDFAAVARRRLWRNAGSESRTDPLETPVSPDFRAAVSLGLLTFAPNALNGKRLNSLGCA